MVQAQPQEKQTVAIKPPGVATPAGNRLVIDYLGNKIEFDEEEARAFKEKNIKSKIELELAKAYAPPSFGDIISGKWSLPDPVEVSGRVHALMEKEGLVRHAEAISGVRKTSEGGYVPSSMEGGALKDAKNREQTLRDSKAVKDAEVKYPTPGVHQPMPGAGNNWLMVDDGKGNLVYYRDKNNERVWKPDVFKGSTDLNDKQLKDMTAGTSAMTAEQRAEKAAKLLSEQIGAKLANNPSFTPEKIKDKVDAIAKSEKIQEELKFQQENNLSPTVRAERLQRLVDNEIGTSVISAKSLQDVVLTNDQLSRAAAQVNRSNDLEIVNGVVVAVGGEKPPQTARNKESGMKVTEITGGVAANAPSAPLQTPVNPLVAESPKR